MRTPVKIKYKEDSSESDKNEYCERLLRLSARITPFSNYAFSPKSDADVVFYFDNVSEAHKMAQKASELEFVASTSIPGNPPPKKLRPVKII